jgi:hypothetical protein
MTDAMRGHEPSQRAPMASAAAVANPRARDRQISVDACPDGVTASTQRHDEVDVNANPYEKIGRGIGVVLSALTSSLFAN